MRGLESRCCLAMARVVLSFDVEASEIIADDAGRMAFDEGIRDHAYGRHTLPVMFVDEPALSHEWDKGQQACQQDADVCSSTRQDGACHDVSALIAAAEKQAFAGCGLSDVLYDARIQEAFASILQDAPAEHRQATEAALRARGYDPDFEPYEPQDGECSLTGIDEDCCPCGRHP